MNTTYDEITPGELLTDLALFYCPDYYVALAAKGVDMESPYMTFEETAAFFRRSVKTIRNWNSRDRRTGEKRMCGFPDPAHHGLFLKSDIEKFGKLACHD